MNVPLVAAPTLVPGRKLDRYELVCPIAEGGMASVWIARQTGGHGFEKMVAIKTILPQFASDIRFQKMFIEESRIASRIEHPNVTQIRDVGEEDGITYLVMEYVDGDPLWTVQKVLNKKGQRMAPGVLLRIMADACGGLHAAHELRDLSGALVRVVHRDVSPQNILVNASGVAKVIDFGIAKSLDESRNDTNTGPLKGKVRYMAPEQARGEALDRRVDIWAVGAVIYYLLSGKAPCEAENEVATLVRLRANTTPAPLPSSLPHPIAGAVMKALAVDRDNRYESAADMQRALESAMAECEMTASSSGVAAFIAENAPEPGAKRKKAVAYGMKLVADRASMASLPRLPSDPSLSSLPSDPFRSRSNSSIPPMGSIAPAGAPPPPGSVSTMRAAAVELGIGQPVVISRGFPLVPAVIGGLFVAIALAAGFKITHRGGASQAAAAAPAAPMVAAPPAGGPAAPTGSATAAAPPAGKDAPKDPGIKTVDFSELPAARSAAMAPPPPVQRGYVPPRAVTPQVAPVTAPPGPAPAPATKPVRTQPDDGF